MKRKFTFLIAAALMLLVFMMPSLVGWGQTTTYEQLTSIANIDEDAQYVLGIDGVGFHYSNTSGWGLTGLPADHTPFYYRLVVAEDGQSFKAYVDTPIYGYTYYMTIPTSNAFTMTTNSQADNTDLIIGTTYISETNYAVANKTTTERHLRRNGSSGLRSYAGSTGAVAFFYKVIPATPAYTITAQSNNDSYGTVSLSGNVITGSPNSGYQYAEPAYTVDPENSATVSQNGNAFTVTPSANTTVTINFEAIPTYTVTLGDDSSTLTETIGGAGVTLPTRSAIGSYEFAGWSETNVSVETTTAPTIIQAGTYYPTSNITLYPVYTRTEAGGANPTAYAVGNTGDFAIVSEKQDEKYYALPTNPTVSSGKITAVEITVSEKNGVKYVTPTDASGFTWTIASATNGYTLSDGSKYIYHSNGGASGTNLTYGTSTNYTWAFTIDGNYVKMAGMSGSTTNNRGLLFQGTTIGGYALSNWGASGYYKSMILPIFADETTYYWSSPVAAAVEKPVITVAENPFLFSTTVTITCETEGATIYYTTNEDVPTSSSTQYTDPFTINSTTTIKAIAIKGEDESSVATATATKNLAEPTVTVSGDLILDLAGGTNVSAGALTAAVTYNEAAVEGATVTWSSNNTDIAEIDASTGGVTIKAVGEVTFTATYAGNSDYAEATGTKTVTVINSYAPGAVNNPYSVAQARAAIDAGTGITGVYATGIVCTKATSLNSGKLSYYISDDGTESTRLEAYNGFGLNGASFTSIDDVELGATVVIYGNLTKYSTTYKFAANNYLISYTAPAAPNPQTLTVIATNGSVEIAGKTLDNGSCEVNEGASVTATATPSNHYTFTSWTAEGVALADATANPLTFTMPTNGVTLTANFTENAKHNATFYVLGVEYGTDANVYEGSAITFPSVTAPNGYTFMGWTTAAIVGTQDGAPATLVTAANMGNANIDYYAVFAIQIGSYEGTVELTNTTIKNNREGKTSYGNYTIGDWSGKFMINKNGEVYSLQLGYNASSSASAYNSHLTTPECPYNITSITISTNNNTANGRTFYLCSASDLGTASSTDATYGYGSTSSANGSVIINVSGNTKQFHIYPNGTAYIESITLAYSNVSYSSYCTTVNELSGDLSGVTTTAGNAYYISAAANVPAGVAVTIYGALGNADASLLTINNNGQLIVNNTLAATLKKMITGYGNDDNVKTGWNFIASPVNVNNLAPSAVTNMLANTYDLYQLNPSDTKWENYKEHTGNANQNFNLVNGKGYLYANSDDVTLSFAGVIKPFTTEDNANQVALAPGWNLVGNPYTFNVYSSKSYYTITTEDDVNVITAVTSANAAIAPCTGIVIKNTGTETDYVAFLKTASEWSNGNKGNIQLTLAQQTTNRGNANIDNVIVSFNEGSELEKFYFIEQNASLYIPQGNEEYAIVSSNGQGEMPVNFKAAQNGTYTLSIEAENVEMDYLHLIDNMTGADVDLLQTPSYSFTSKTTDYASRFRLVFSANSVNDDSTSSETFAFVNGEEIVITNAEADATLQVVDMTGRILVNTKGANRLSTAGMTPGVYVIRMVNGEKVKTQKIVVR